MYVYEAVHARTCKRIRNQCENANSTRFSRIVRAHCMPFIVACCMCNILNWCVGVAFCFTIFCRCNFFLKLWSFIFILFSQCCYSICTFQLRCIASSLAQCRSEEFSRCNCAHTYVHICFNICLHARTQ